MNRAQLKVAADALERLRAYGRARRKAAETPRCDPPDRFWVKFCAPDGTEIYVAYPPGDFKDLLAILEGREQAQLDLIGIER